MIDQLRLAWSMTGLSANKIGVVSVYLCCLYIESKDIKTVTLFMYKKGLPVTNGE